MSGTAVPGRHRSRHHQLVARVRGLRRSAGGSVRLPRRAADPAARRARATARRDTLPSFLYLPTADERRRGTSRPVGGSPRRSAACSRATRGRCAPRGRCRRPSRGSATRPPTAPRRILPWGADDAATVSPVDASARILAAPPRRVEPRHRRRTPASGGSNARRVVLTVPASFDQEARELTLEAARDAGLAHVTLLEEPLAAFYAWIAVAPARAATRHASRGGELRARLRRRRRHDRLHA